MKNPDMQKAPLDSLIEVGPEGDFADSQTSGQWEQLADPSSSGDLRQWTAQDFSNIYVRFRPHLERYARKFLPNPVHAEEVVQDSFLYLMTTLPELDSELGVLKFLKWKVRLLALDILRSARYQRESYVSDYDDQAAEALEVSANLERAEDNAVIRMALSSLSPRQREVLIANVYEEKSIEQISDQLQLSPNATRQLLFRARSAFRKSLVGEAEVSGKSVSEILSLAVKKAASELRENASKVGGFVLILAAGFGVVSSLTPQETSYVAEPAPVQSPPAESQVSPSIPQPRASDNPGLGPGIEAQESSGGNKEDPPVSGTDSSLESGGLGASESLETNVVTQTPMPQPVDIQPASDGGLNTKTMGTILNTNVSNAGIYTGSYSPQFGEIFEGSSIEVFGGTGISSFLDFDPSAKTVRYAVFQMWVDGKRYSGVARNTVTETLENDGGYTVLIVSEEFYVVDERMKVFSESPLAGATVVTTLDLDMNGSPISASLKID